MFCDFERLLMNEKYRSMIDVQRTGSEKKGLKTKPPDSIQAEE